MSTDVGLPEESEQLDQLQSDDTLVDRGVDDVLDEGYTTPEKWSAAQGFGNTPAEMRHGETLEQRMAQEEPETDPRKPTGRWNPNGEKREVGSRRAGRLVDLHGQHANDGEQVGEEAGIDGGAACAEEAAVHVIDPSEDTEDGDEADA